MPRGGTRNFADLANAHPNISLFGELQGNALPAVAAAMEGLETVHNLGNPRGLERFQARKHHIALTLLALHSKNPRPHLDNDSYEAGVVGFKTPNIEKEFLNIDTLLAGFGERRVFFYCCRHLDQNYLSLKSLGWRENTEHYFRGIHFSLKNARKIYKAARKRKDWKFHVLHLDSYIGSPDKANWLIDNLYGHLGVETDPLQVAGYVESTVNRNATERKIGSERRKALTQEEREEFENAHEIRKLLDEVNNEWGTSLRMVGTE